MGAVEQDPRIERVLSRVERDRQIRALRREGMDRHSIAARFGLSPERVSQISGGLDQRILPDKPSGGIRLRGDSKAQRDAEIQRLYRKGERVAEIYGIGEVHVREIVRGVPRGSKVRVPMNSAGDLEMRDIPTAQLVREINRRKTAQAAGLCCYCGNVQDSEPACRSAEGHYRLGMPNPRRT